MAMNDPQTNLFKALADPTRRQIYERLAHIKEQTVSEITVQAGISQPAVSKHLKVLTTAGLVHPRPQGRKTYFRADLNGLLPLVNWMDHYGAFWRSRFENLENILKRMNE